MRSFVYDDYEQPFRYFVDNCKVRVGSFLKLNNTGIQFFNAPDLFRLICTQDIKMRSKRKMPYCSLKNATNPV